MLEIKPEHMKKGEIYYIQNEASENKVEYDKYTNRFRCFGRQKGIFTGIFTEYWVFFTNIENFNGSYCSYATGDGSRNILYCKFYLPQAQIINNRKNYIDYVDYYLKCLLMEKFINEQTNTLLGTEIINVSERTKNNNSYFISNETKKQIHDLKIIYMYMKELKVILPMYWIE
jgi:hypothetical protein